MNKQLFILLSLICIFPLKGMEPLNAALAQGAQEHFYDELDTLVQGNLELPPTPKKSPRKPLAQLQLSQTAVNLKRNLFDEEASLPALNSHFDICVYEEELSAQTVQTEIADTDQDAASHKLKKSAKTRTQRKSVETKKQTLALANKTAKIDPAVSAITPFETLKECPFGCGAALTNAKEYLDHVQHNHSFPIAVPKPTKIPLKTSYSCEFCGETYQTPKEYVDHKIATHYKISENPPKKIELAPSVPASLALDQMEAQPTLTPMAPANNSPVVDVPEQREEEKAEEGTLAHKCPDCYKSFPRAWQLRNHSYQHTNIQRPFPCPHLACKHSAVTKQALLKHLNSSIHNNQKLAIPQTMKPIQPTQLEKKPEGEKSDSSIASAHEEKEKKHKCDECGKSFARISTLKDHLLFHAGIKPFGCPYCPSRFTQQSNRTTHIKAMHKGQEILKEKIAIKQLVPAVAQNPALFYCLVCNQGFQTSAELSTHISYMKSNPSHLELEKESAS